MNNELERVKKSLGMNEEEFEMFINQLKQNLNLPDEALDEFIKGLV